MPGVAVLTGITEALGAEAVIPAVADVGALGAADVGAGLAAADTSALTAAAVDPTLSASIAGSGAAGLDAASATFGPFDPGLFAANSADVAAGGFGTDLGAATDFGAGATDLTAASEGVTGAAAGEIPSGASIAGTPGSGFFSGGNLGTSFTGQPFSDVFSSADTSVGAGGGQVSDIGTFGGGINAPAGAEGAPAQVPGGGAIGTEPSTAGVADQGPIVSSDQGIVNTGGDANFGERFNASFGEPSIATPQQTIGQEFSSINQMTPSNPGFMNSPTGGDLSGVLDTPGANTAAGAPIDQAALQSGSLFNTGGLVPGTGGEAVPADFSGSLTGQGVASTNFSPGGFDTGITTANVAPSPQMVAGAPNVATTAAAPPLGSPTTVTAAPGAAAGIPPAAPGTASAGGIDPLTGLRMGAAGASIISSGINIANALNQPAYTALQPQSYPGSPFNPGPNAPGFPANNQFGGGIAGGLAANRLAIGLMSGATPQQLAASGLISPDRATRLQGTYSGITQQYARQLGVSAQSLSPGVKQMIAAHALADSGLGGR